MGMQQCGAAGVEYVTSSIFQRCETTEADHRQPPSRTGKTSTTISHNDRASQHVLHDSEQGGKDCYQPSRCIVCNIVRPTMTVALDGSFYTSKPQSERRQAYKTTHRQQRGEESKTRNGSTPKTTIRPLAKSRPK